MLHSASIVCCDLTNRRLVMGPSRLILKQKVFVTLVQFRHETLLVRIRKRLVTHGSKWDVDSGLLGEGSGLV